MGFLLLPHLTHLKKTHFDLWFIFFFGGIVKAVIKLGRSARPEGGVIMVLSNPSRYKFLVRS